LRYQENLLNRYPDYLKAGQRLRVPGRRKKTTIVLDFALRALRHQLEIGGPDPKWFKDTMRRCKTKWRRKQDLRTYIENYFDFPTPGNVIRLTLDPKLNLFLRRWHKEYSFICQYTHVALGKGMIVTLSEFKSREAGERLESYGRALAGRVLFTSHSATASACAFAVAALRNTYGAKSYVKDHWNELHTRALPAKAFWSLYIKDLLSS